MKKIKKHRNSFRRWITLLWFSLFHGMAAADSIINGSSQTSDGDVEINQQLRGGGVFNDMLEEKVTKEVEEMRDKHYRVYEESKKVDTSTITMVQKDSGEIDFIGADKKLKKKTLQDFIKKIKVFGEDELPVRTIQDNFDFAKHTMIYNAEVPAGLYDYEVVLTITRDGFVPRFELEKFVTKMVVRQKEGSDRAKVDFYLPTMASQFGKIDAILVSNLHQMYETKNLRSDIVDFKTIEWCSYKAWNTKDLSVFSYDDIKAESINEFDGHFVITFDCHIVKDGVYLPNKYKTKELDKKYETEAPKHDAIDIGTLLRRQKRDKKKNESIINNLEKTKIEI